jgi:hypothetical protein
MTLARTSYPLLKKHACAHGFWEEKTLRLLIVWVVVLWAIAGARQKRSTETRVFGNRSWRYIIDNDFL